MYICAERSDNTGHLPHAKPRTCVVYKHTRALIFSLRLEIRTAAAAAAAANHRRIGLPTCLSSIRVRPIYICV
uniref:Uncharacterized protein n=1 Tax=Trichogramma kaykai TaxID=54128 RepID=A0ABD2WWH9_9HYME